MTGWTDRARAVFLQVLAESCNVSEACRRANISRSWAYVRRSEDEDFAAAWKEAEETAADRLEQVAWDRATEGESDRMLEILLKAHRPEKFVDKLRTEHTGPNGGPVAVEVTFRATDATRPA